MNTSLKLHNRSAKFNSSIIPFINNENLIINVDYKFKNDIKYIAKINDNLIVDIKNNNIVIPSLNFGVYKIVIQAIKNGVVLNDWICEDLIIKTFENNNIVIPEIEDLKSQINEYKIIVKDLTKQCNELKDLILEGLKL